MARKTKVVIDPDAFLKSREDFTTRMLILSTAINDAAKAYIAHTDTVLAGDEVLSFAQLTKAISLAAASASAVGHTIPVSADLPEASSAKKRKRQQKPREEGAPKRPNTAYFRFLSEVRPDLTKELAQAGQKRTPGDLSAVATQRWNAMTDAEKAPYKAAYRADMEVYNADILDFKSKQAAPAAVVEEAVDDEDDEDEEEEVVEQVSSRPVVEEDDSDDDDTDSDSDADDTPEPAPIPPPKVKKAHKPKEVSSPEMSKKALKVKKDAAPTFNSINSSRTASQPAAIASSSAKKRKAEATAPMDNGTTPKKKRGRPSNAFKEAAMVAINATPASTPSVAKPKKSAQKKAAEV